MVWKLPNNNARPNGIKELDFNNSHYIKVSRYSCDGEDKVQMVPNKRGNKEKLIKMYYQEMKDYLDVNVSIYESYNYTKMQKKINKNLIKILIISSILMLLASVPLLGTYEALGFLGITLDVIAIPTLATGINLYNKKRIDDKKVKFIKEYEDMRERLRVCTKNENIVNEPTKYKGLEVEQHDKIVEINKIKSKTPDKNKLKNAV